MAGHPKWNFSCSNCFLSSRNKLFLRSLTEDEELFEEMYEDNEVKQRLNQGQKKREKKKKKGKKRASLRFCADHS
jgi:hypothetical protein